MSAHIRDERGKRSQVFVVAGKKGARVDRVTVCQWSPIASYTPAEAFNLAAEIRDAAIQARRKP